MPKYSIIPHDEDEIPLLAFIKEHDLKGYMYPNTDEGSIYRVHMDEEMATLLPLKFRLKSFFESNTPG